MTEAVTKHRQLEGTHSVGREVELYNPGSGYRVRSRFLVNIVGSPIFILAKNLVLCHSDNRREEESRLHKGIYIFEILR